MAADDGRADDGVEESQTWEDLSETLWVLWPREVALLELLREGKGPSDVAEVLGFPTRSKAHREIERVLKVARFYHRHRAAVRKLSKGALPLERRVVVAMRMYAVGRVQQREVAETLGYGHRRDLCVAMLRARRRLAELGGHADVLDLLGECSRDYGGLRSHRRRLMADEAWRDDLLKDVQGLIGKVWYVWGGQDVEVGEADCSGLVLELLKRRKVLPADYPDRTAQGLAREFNVTVRNPRCGDLAFYGRSWSGVTHVMVYVGDEWGRGEMVAGMCGGRRNMKSSWARLVGAGLWLRRPTYRNDLLGYRRVQ